MRFRILIISIITIVMISSVSALPEILDIFNTRYDTFKTKLDTCETCHKSVEPMTTCGEICHTLGKPEKVNDLNPYGGAIKNNLNKESEKAFKSIEILDSDGDKVSNIDEIKNLTKPGNQKDFPKNKSTK